MPAVCTHAVVCARTCLPPGGSEFDTMCTRNGLGARTRATSGERKSKRAHFRVAPGRRDSGVYHARAGIVTRARARTTTGTQCEARARRVLYGVYPARLGRRDARPSSRADGTR